MPKTPSATGITLAAVRCANTRLRSRLPQAAAVATAAAPRAPTVTLTSEIIDKAGRLAFASLKRR